MGLDCEYPNSCDCGCQDEPRNTGCKCCGRETEHSDDCLIPENARLRAALQKAEAEFSARLETIKKDRRGWIDRCAKAEAESVRLNSELGAACELAERSREIIVIALNKGPEYWYDNHDNGLWSAEHIAFAIAALFAERDEALKQAKDLADEVVDLHLVAQSIKHYWQCDPAAGIPCVRCQRDAERARAEKYLAAMLEWVEAEAATNAALRALADRPTKDAVAVATSTGQRQIRAEDAIRSLVEEARRER